MLFLAASCVNAGAREEYPVTAPGPASRPAVNAGQDVAEILVDPCQLGGMHVLAYSWSCAWEFWPAKELGNPHKRDEGLHLPILVAYGLILGTSSLPIPPETVRCAYGGEVGFWLVPPFSWAVIDRYGYPFHWVTREVPVELRGLPLYAQGFAARDFDWRFPLTGLPVVKFDLGCLDTRADAPFPKPQSMVEKMIQGLFK